MANTIESKLACYHCGEQCPSDCIQSGNHVFCCEGCKMVYGILNQNGLCDYYALNEKPGINRRAPGRLDKFNFLDDESIERKLIHFKNEDQTHVCFHLPQIHCSSCLYLLENLHKIQSDIISCKVDFPRKSVSIIFNHRNISLRSVAELLCSIGYEPYISLNDLKNSKPMLRKTLVYQLGIAGFCFANIMLLSFPEYLGLGKADLQLRSAFRSINFILSIPVFFFSAQPFFISAWKSLRNHFLNIDGPIALAIILTFARSVYEVISGTGAGYFDSMSGIVFFMLAGRVLQEKTHKQLSFERDYSSYFPIAVTIIKDGRQFARPLPEVKPGDTLLIHQDELIPVDGILTRGEALIDYSFVTGESLPVLKEMGELIYAGGKQTGSNIELLSIKEVTQSYLTSLWNQDNKDKSGLELKKSFVHLVSKYFTILVLAIATSAALYWYFHDPSRMWNAVTAVMIIACPCALLLSSSFTNGNILQILGRNQFYLRSAQVIEDIAALDHIVFDKTGTLTSTREQDIEYEGTVLSKQQQLSVAVLASQSNHPLSVALSNYLPRPDFAFIENYTVKHGKGTEAIIDRHHVSLGSRSFILGEEEMNSDSTAVYVAIDNKPMGRFIFRNHYRKELNGLVKWLRPRFKMSVISGDNRSEKNNLSKIFGECSHILFQQMPQDKLNYIRKLQSKGEKVGMIGDGLNDGVALMASNVGIAITEDTNNFTPASDAILQASRLPMLPAFIKLCRANRRIIMASFILSVVYNLVGLFFAVHGTLSPLIAAILMPSSSLSILLITFGSSSLYARYMKL